MHGIFAIYRVTSHVFGTCREFWC